MRMEGTAVMNAETLSTSPPCSGHRPVQAGYFSDDLSIRLHAPHLTDTRFVSANDVVAIHFGPYAGASAVNSDKITEYDRRIPGALAFHKAGCSHYVRWDTPSRYMQFSISSALRERLIRETANQRHIQEYLPGKPTPQSLKLADMAWAFVRNGNQGGRLAAESIALLVMNEVVQNAGQQSAPSEYRNGCSRQDFGDVLAFIHEHLETDLSLTTLADLTGMSMSVFHRRFKQSLGVTPHRYIQDVRLEKAKQDLMQPDRSLAEIAYDCGFSSQSHFTTVFGKRIGMSPGKYRAGLRS